VPDHTPLPPEVGSLKGQTLTGWKLDIDGRACIAAGAGLG
jgi:hypothetical protein